MNGPDDLAGGREPRGAQEPAEAILPPSPACAAVVFGARLPLARQFAEVLADTGVSHGLIGPREVPILWERHVLNCAVTHEAFPAGSAVADVGSGAGLPGLALAIARPDLQLHLIEPMLRRTTWLTATVAELGLDNCTVHRGRAEEFHEVLSVPYATARAVARIDKLARWTFPLLRSGGTLVALKGSQGEQELTAQDRVLRKLGMVDARLGSYGEGLLAAPTATLELTVRAQAGPSVRRPARPRSPAGRART
jgi:16S rRNA (guanine527-N7)-methyltransferase